MIQIDETNIGLFNSVKEVAERDYKSIKEVFCPFLNKKVALNTKGLEHIKFKSRNKARSKSDQFVRLKFLKLVPEVLQNSHTLQEHSRKRSFEHQSINSRWEERAVDVDYYGFIAIIKQTRFKVIVKQVVGGLPYFWSIIPFWKSKDPITGEIKKVFCEGDLETQ